MASGIPRDAHAYRSLLTRAVRSEWGLAAPTATMAAQVHQESAWRRDARSPVGAMGLAQFMPGTVDWWGELRPDLGPADAWNPAWALRAMAAYNRWLHGRLSGTADDCHRWAMVLASYNGGLGWVQRDRRLAAATGHDPAAWWGSVELVNAGRSQAAWRENRGYPRRILHTLEPRYVQAGWGPGVCP